MVKKSRIISPVEHFIKSLQQILANLNSSDLGDDPVSVSDNITKLANLLNRDLKALPQENLAKHIDKAQATQLLVFLLRAQNQHIDAIKCLLQLGANPYEQVGGISAVRVADAKDQPKPKILRLLLEQDAATVEEKNSALPLVLKHFPDITHLVKKHLHAQTNLFIKINNFSMLEVLAAKQPAIAKKLIKKLDPSLSQSYKNSALLISVNYLSNNKASISYLLQLGADPFMASQGKKTLLENLANNSGYEDILELFIQHVKPTHNLAHRQLAFNAVMQHFQDNSAIFRLGLQFYPQGLFELAPSGQNWLRIMFAKNNAALDVLLIRTALHVLRNPPFPPLPLTERELELDLLCSKIYTYTFGDLNDLMIVLRTGANPCFPVGDSALSKALANTDVNSLALFLGEINLEKPEQYAELFQAVAGFTHWFDYFLLALLRNLSHYQDDPAGFMRVRPWIKQLINTYLDSIHFCNYTILDNIVSAHNMTENVKEKVLLFMLAQIIKKAVTPAQLCELMNYINNNQNLKSFVTTPHSQQQSCDSLILVWIQNRLLQLKVVDKAPLNAGANKILQAGHHSWFKQSLVEKINRASTPEIAHNLLEESLAATKEEYRVFVPK